MKKKQHIITTGAYDSFKIVATVEGNARPAISTLRQSFLDHYGFYSYKGKARTHEPIDDMRKRITQDSDATARAKADGLDDCAYQYGGIGAQFVQWLIRDHGYTLADISECHV